MMCVLLKFACTEWKMLAVQQFGSWVTLTTTDCMLLSQHNTSKQLWNKKPNNINWNMTAAMQKMKNTVFFLSLQQVSHEFGLHFYPASCFRIQVAEFLFHDRVSTWYTSFTCDHQSEMQIKSNKNLENWPFLVLALTIAGLELYRVWFKESTEQAAARGR